jgi:hypothetical protein
VFEVYKRADDRYALLAKAPRNYSTEIGASLGVLGAATAVGATLARKGYFKRRPTGGERLSASQPIARSFQSEDDSVNRYGQFHRTSSESLRDSNVSKSDVELLHAALEELGENDTEPLDGQLQVSHASLRDSNDDRKSGDLQSNDFSSPEIELLRAPLEASDVNVRPLKEVRAEIPTSKQNLEDAQRTNILSQRVKNDVTPSPDDLSALSKLDKDSFASFLRRLSKPNAPIQNKPKPFYRENHPKGATFFKNIHTRSTLTHPYYLIEYTAKDEEKGRRLRQLMNDYLRSNEPISPGLEQAIKEFGDFIKAKYGGNDKYYQTIKENWN